MIQAKPTFTIYRAWKEYRITDETPDSPSNYHRYSVICWKRSFVHRNYNLEHGDNDIYAVSAKTALKVYLIKHNRVNKL
jgi:hypothetical protein